MNQCSPFLLTDKKVLNTGTASGVGRVSQCTFDPVRTENPQRGGYLLDEIRLYAVGAAFQGLCYSELLQVRISLGHYFLTHDFVPLRLLAPRFNQVAGGLANGGVSSNDSSTVWRLDKPLYVAQTDLVSVEMRLDPAIVTTSLLTNFNVSSLQFDVHVALICRSTPAGFKQPKTVDIPYCAYWNSGLLPLGAVSQLRSTENDLKNPYNEPLRISGIGGYINFDFDDANSPSANYNTGGVGTRNSGGWQMGALLNRDCNIRIHDSKGAMLIRDLTPFGQVFHPRSGFWDMSCTMPKKSFYIVAPQIDLRGYQSWYGANGGVAVSPYMAMSIVGYHTVSLQGSQKP